MSSPQPGFRRTNSALRDPGTLGKSGSPSRGVTWNDITVVHHLDEAPPSPEEQPTSWREQLESSISGEDDRGATIRRKGRKMPEARVRNARKHGELNFGTEREPLFSYCS